MGEIRYKPLIEGMTWSFSRIKTYEDCPYRWYLTYIREKSEDEMFYASYGTFMHEILAKYYSGQIRREEMLPYYLAEFRNRVKGTRPPPETAAKYVEQGAEYLRTFRPIEGEILGVEKKVDFSVNGIPFTGYIDLVVRNEYGLGIVDHKTRVLRQKNPFSIRVTVQDRLREDMFRQLYLYAEAVRQVFGELPKILAFNCFRAEHIARAIVEEELDEEKLAATISWAEQTVRQIEETDSFEAKPDYYKCRWICGLNPHCIYSEPDREGE